VVRFGFLVNFFQVSMNFLFWRRVDTFKIVPGGEVADERLGVDAGELFLTDRECNDGDIGGLDALVAEFLVERQRWHRR